MKHIRIENMINNKILSSVRQIRLRNIKRQNVKKYIIYTKQYTGVYVLFLQTNYLRRFHAETRTSGNEE